MCKQNVKELYDKINDSRMTTGSLNVNRKRNLLDECVFIYYLLQE